MSSSVKLYPHNQTVYDSVVKTLKSGCNNILVTQGMGVGKSFIFMALADQHFSAKRILYVVPKTTIERNLRKYDAFEDIEHHVEFATYASFNSDDRVTEAYDAYDVFIIDEAHHLGSDFYGQKLQLLLDLVREDKNKTFIGMTATPVRDSDGVDVASFFDAQINGLSTIEAIQQGLMPQVEYLVCTTDITSEEKKKFRQILDLSESETLLDNIIAENPKNKWLVYFSSLQDVKDGFETVQNLFPGYRIIKITSDTNDSQDLIDGIQEGEKVVIVSVDMLLEGIHLPEMQGVLLFRRVQSLTVFTQIFGRITSIGSTEPPLFIDCTDTAQRMLGKLMGGYQNGGSFQRNGTREILITSLKNKKYFDIAALLEELRSSVEPVYVNGVKYLSIKAACDANGAVYKTVLSMMKQKEMSLEEAIKRAKEVSRDVTINGVTYLNRLDACKALGISYRAVRRLIENGAPPEEAILRILANEGKFEFRGKFYRSLSACCKEYGISRDNVNSRVHNHSCTPQEALEHYLKNGTNVKAYPVTVRGKMFSSKTECVVSFGFKPDYSNHVQNYAKRNNMTWEESMEAILDKKDRAVVVNGVGYRTRNEAIIKCGVKPGRVKELEKTGLTLEEAINQAKIAPSNNVFDFRGERFPSFKDACEGYRQKAATVSAYASKHKVSKEAALEHFIEKKPPFKFGDKAFNSAKECCEFYDLNPVSISHHVSRREGASWQDVIQEALNGDLPTNAVPVKVKGKEYDSAADACRDFGLKYSRLAARRRKSGESWESVIKQAINKGEGVG